MAPTASTPRVAAAAVALLCLFGGAACRRQEPPPTHRLVVLAVDGLDPTLVRRWIDEKKLPNLGAVAARGGFALLEPPAPVSSPAAWASFATGVNPGKHDVFGGKARNRSTYQLESRLPRLTPGMYLFDYLPLRRPRAWPVQAAMSFWTLVAKAGVHSTIVNVPLTFPPDPLAAGEVLSGLPLPDIRGTLGTYAYYASDLDKGDETRHERGAILHRLIFSGLTAQTLLVGPPDPVLTAARRTDVMSQVDERPAGPAVPDLSIPMTVEWLRDDHAVTLQVADAELRLTEGEWSRAVPVAFSANLFVRVHGLVRFHLAGATDAVRLYASPIEWDAASPPTPISSPAAFAGALVKSRGAFGTLGILGSARALTDERLDERAFMDDAYRAFDDRAQTLLSLFESRPWRLFVGSIETLDPVQHVMWRLVDPAHPAYDAALAAKIGPAIERMYRRVDTLVGEVLERVDPTDDLFVVSDHGFHSFRTAVHLNTWLAREGFLALADADPGARRSIDWLRTRAYALAPGGVFLNVRGREPRGTVSPGDEYDRLATDLVTRLGELRDPSTGGRIVRSVVRRDEVFSGRFVDDSPDLVLGFADGYRVSPETARLEVPQPLMSPNRRKWSGDHAGFDPAETAGVLISTRKLSQPRYRIVDVAPTVLAKFGVAVPKEMDGHPIQ